MKTLAAAALMLASFSALAQTPPKGDCAPPLRAWI